MRPRSQFAMAKTVFNRHHAALHAVAHHYSCFGASSGGFQIDLVAAVQAQARCIVRMQRYRIVRMDCA